MNQTEVMEKLKNGALSYTATITLTNSKKIGFTRRDLALCFFPKKVVEKADRNYEVISVDGAILPFDNPKMVRRIWDIVQQKYIYDGTVRKETRHNFDWSKIMNRIRTHYKILSITLEPERHTIPTQIQIKTATFDKAEHDSIIIDIIQRLKQTSPHLTFIPPHCEVTISGACDLLQ